MCTISEYLKLAQTQALERICLIVDMEGFFLPKFYCRELGYANYLGGCGSKYYEMSMKYTDLILSQQKQVAFVRRRIHGMPFIPTHFEDAKPQEQLAQDVMELYELYKTEAKTVVAYKGGHIERDILLKLDIPSVDLEAFGRPKVYDLMHLGLGYEVWDCGHHHGAGTAHCALAECQILQEWVVFKINKLKRRVEDIKIEEGQQ